MQSGLQVASASRKAPPAAGNGPASDGRATVVETVSTSRPHIPLAGSAEVPSPEASVRSR